MLTRTSEYALRALIHLVQHDADWPIPGRAIAASAQIPPKYLSKILGDLVRKGILTSSPGKTGGFAFRKSAARTSLFEVLSTFEQFEKRRCPFGNNQCNDKNPCLAHDQWKKVVEAEQGFMKKTTIEQIAIKKTRGRSRRSKR